MRNWLPRLGAALLLLSLCSKAGSGAVDPNSNKLYGFINGNRTLTYAYPGPMYFVQGDVVVNPGATLTIEPGVLVYFEADHDTLHGGEFPNLAELTVFGSLVADGSAGDSIRFWTSGVGEWGQIRIEGSGSAALRKISVHGPRKGIVLIGSGNVQESGISASQVCIESQHGGSIQDCELSDADQGLYANGGPHTIARLTVRNALNAVLAYAPGSTLQDCRLVGRGYGTGLSIAGGVSTVAENPTNVRPIEISGFGSGIYASGAEITNVLLHDNFEGIRFAPSTGNAVNYCTLVRNAGTALVLATSYSFFTMTNSIVAQNGAIAGYGILFGCAGYSSWDYSDIWSSGGSGVGCPIVGAHMAGFDPFFQDTFGNDFRLSPASIFYEYSNSGGQIGAYGPGPGRPVPAHTTTWGRLKTGYR